MVDRDPDLERRHVAAEALLCRRRSLREHDRIPPVAESDALITGDNLRADVAAEFYIKVQKIREHILAAATSLGERSVDAESVKHLVNQKLVSALRTVAATPPPAPVRAGSR